MGQIQFYGAISLDGYLATLDDQIDWLTTLPNIPADVGAQTLRQMTSAILGRVTYDAVQALAPNAPLNSHNPQMTSYVMTHQSRPNQPGFTFTDEPVTTLVRRLKRDGNVWIVGGSGVLTPPC